VSSMKTKGNILTFRFFLGSVKSCIVLFFDEESCVKLIISLSYLYICNNNGEGFAQQTQLSLPLRRWKMAAPLTSSPQHPRGPGVSLFSFLTVIDIITIYKSIWSFTCSQRCQSQNLFLRNYAL